MTTPRTSRPIQPRPDGVASSEAGLVEALRSTQSELVRASGSPDRLLQPGAVILGEPLELPEPPAGHPARPGGDGPDHESSVIETFLIELSSEGAVPACEAMGDNRALEEWWRPWVLALAVQVQNAAQRWGLGLGGPVTVSASATMVAAVNHQAHVDDEGFRPDDGVGLVAIVASHAGPVVARHPVPCRPRPAPSPVTIDPDAVDRFAALAAAGPEGPAAQLQWCPPDRVAVLCRFGQLHAGPVLAPAVGRWSPIRRLLVLRASTKV